MINTTPREHKDIYGPHNHHIYDTETKLDKDNNNTQHQQQIPVPSTSSTTNRTTTPSIQQDKSTPQTFQAIPKQQV